ncbi:MAG: energy transducer TonB [Bosea sp. (in: a-proteobacteria)]
MRRDSPHERALAATLRWSLAALVAVALHSALVWLALTLRANDAEAAVGAQETAILIDLSPPEPPAPAASAEPEPSEAVSPDPDLPKSELADPVVPEPEAAGSPSVSPPDTAASEDPPLQTALLDIPLPAVPDAAAMLPAPALKPLPPKAIAPRERAKPRAVQRQTTARPKPASPPPSRAAAAPTPQARGAAMQAFEASPSWRGALQAHLNRYKRFPDGAKPGLVRVAFAIDQQGRVLSASLAASSGDARLDAEALALVRRASPMPAPPTSAGSGLISLAVPIRFDR